MKLKRLAALVSFSVLAGWSIFTVELLAQNEPLQTAWMPSRSARLAARTDARNPQIQTWADQIKAKTGNAIEQAALAETLVGKEISYDDSSFIDGVERMPSLPEILLRKRGNCAAQAVVLASLCQALNIDVSIHSRADHAWAVVSPASDLGHY